MINREVEVIDPLRGSTDRRFYVYLYRDPRPATLGIPLYVGKGSDGGRARPVARALKHWTKGARNPLMAAVLKKIRSEGLAPQIEIVARFATEAEAFEHETALIKQIGRRDTGAGTLCNLTDGGDGPCGLIVSDSTRELLRASSLRAKGAPEARALASRQAKERHADPEFVERRAAALRAVLGAPEKRAQKSKDMKEIHARPGDREKRAAAQKATLATPEARALKSRASKAAQAVPEVKKKHAAALRNRWSSEEARAEQSARMLALHADPAHKAKHLAAVRKFAASRGQAAHDE